MSMVEVAETPPLLVWLLRTVATPPQSEQANPVAALPMAVAEDAASKPLVPLKLALDTTLPVLDWVLSSEVAGPALPTSTESPIAVDEAWPVPNSKPVATDWAKVKPALVWLSVTATGPFSLLTKMLLAVAAALDWMVWPLP